MPVLLAPALAVCSNVSDARVTVGISEAEMCTEWELLWESADEILSRGIVSDNESDAVSVIDNAKEGVAFVVEGVTDKDDDADGECEGLADCEWLIECDADGDTSAIVCVTCTVPLCDHRGDVVWGRVNDAVSVRLCKLTVFDNVWVTLGIRVAAVTTSDVVGE